MPNTIFKRGEVGDMARPVLVALAAIHSVMYFNATALAIMLELNHDIGKDKRSALTTACASYLRAVHLRDGLVMFDVGLTDKVYPYYRACGERTLKHALDSVNTSVGYTKQELRDRLKAYEEKFGSLDD